MGLAFVPLPALPTDLRPRRRPRPCAPLSGLRTSAWPAWSSSRHSRCPGDRDKETGLSWRGEQPPAFRRGGAGCPGPRRSPGGSSGKPLQGTAGAWTAGRGRFLETAGPPDLPRTRLGPCQWVPSTWAPGGSRPPFAAAPQATSGALPAQPSGAVRGLPARTLPPGGPRGPPLTGLRPQQLGHGPASDSGSLRSPPRCQGARSSATFRPGLRGGVRPTPQTPRRPRAARSARGQDSGRWDRSKEQRGAEAGTGPRAPWLGVGGRRTGGASSIRTNEAARPSQPAPRPPTPDPRGASPTPRPTH